MRSLLTVAILFLFCGLHAQDFERVDAAIGLYPERFANAESLAFMIQRDFDHPAEQLRAAYGWLIHHVEYDPDEYKQFNYGFKDYRERNQKEERTRKLIIERTLQQGVAVCEGYAMVLERMGELLDIPIYLVRGDIKTYFDDIGRPFDTRHMWNIATIDGQNYLFDPTWGAGKYQDRFIPEPSYAYFMADPAWLINTHYPTLAEDTLLEEPISRSLFEQMPLIIAPGLTWDQVIEPKFGVLDATTDTGTFEFRIADIAPQKLTYTLNGKRRKIKYEIEDEVLVFQIPATLGSKELVIYFNDKPALAYTIE